MNILISYISNSGSTYLIARTIAQMLQNASHSVTCKKTTDTTPEELFQSELTLLGSPSWDYTNEQKKRLEGQPHESMIHLLNSAKNNFTAGHQFAIFGAGDNSYTMFCGAVDYMEHFVHDVQGTLIVDSLRIDSYYFNQQNNDEKIKSWSNYLIQTLQKNK